MALDKSQKWGFFSLRSLTSRPDDCLFVGTEVWMRHPKFKDQKPEAKSINYADNLES